MCWDGMIEVYCEDAVMQARVGLLTIGRLSDTERSEVVRHLTDCRSCRSERDDIARVVDMLNVLRSAPDNLLHERLTSPATATAPLLLRPPAQLLDAPGTPHAQFPATVPNRPAPRPISPPAYPTTDQMRLAPHPAGAPARPAAMPARPASSPAVAVERPGPWFIESARPRPGLSAPPFPLAEPYPPVIAPVVVPARRPAPRHEGYLPPRPATGPLSIGPHSHRRPRRWSPRRAVSLVILTVALTAGATLYPWSQTDTPGPIVATAVSGDTAEVTLRAVLRGEADGLGVELTVGGLTPGASYQVYAATVDDDLSLLGQFTGGAGPVRWSGASGVPVDDLVHLSVRDAGGRGLVTATVVRGSQAPL